jgi:hypothetical protein
MLPSLPPLQEIESTVEADAEKLNKINPNRNGSDFQNGASELG